MREVNEISLSRGGNAASFSVRIMKMLADREEPTHHSLIAKEIGRSEPATAAFLGYLKRTGRVVNPLRGHWQLVKGGEETESVLRGDRTMLHQVNYPVQMLHRDRHALGLLRHARKRTEYEFNLVLDDIVRIWEGQNGLCAISGIPMTTYRGLGYQCPTNASLDRIDSCGGYVPGNVQLLCWSVNFLKQRMSNEQVKAFIAAIAAFGSGPSPDIDTDDESE